MKNKFIDNVEENANYTLTENLSLAHKSTLDALLDFFALGGAKRNDINGGVELFRKAFVSDNAGAIRILFYLRDIRGGQGERKIFRECLKWLEENYTEVLKKIIHYVPEYGRWDDMLHLKTDTIIPLIADQLNKDIEQEKPSLLAKWLPSGNATSYTSRKKAKEIINILGMTPKRYRKMLTELRKKIKITETKITKKDYDSIDYSDIPGGAFKKYTKAFYRHDEKKYTNFLKRLKKGEAKVNSRNLYTYEIVELLEKDPETANILWEKQEDFTRGEHALVVADVSGSMRGRPMSISTSLALYFAKKNKGIFKDYFITFSTRPRLIKIQGETLKDKINFIKNADWWDSTNIEAVYNLILKGAKNAPPEDCPKILYIISDMEFDTCIRQPGKTTFENAKEKFEAHDLELPHIVFWNVNSRQNQVPAVKNDKNVTFISGASHSSFKYAVLGKTPKEAMLDIINSTRYSNIQL